MPTGVFLATLAAGFSLAVAARAQQTPTTPTTPTTAATPEDTGVLYVWGKRADRIGQALSASEGQVAFGAFADRPLLRPGELVEVIPGLVATQHSGSGKANQYFLRGFNLDHGTDFSVSFDGAPINLRTNAHGQGYLDLNFLTPELIDQVDYRKGPYSARVGDFSAAGSASFQTFGRLAEPFVSATVGENRYGRLVGALDVGNGYLAADLTTGDGPWDRAENLRRASAMLKQTLGRWSITALGYTADWNSTDQIAARAVPSGKIGRFGTLDPTDGGRSRRLLVAASSGEGDGLKTTVYGQYYFLNLFSDFTYFLDDPVHGDQFEQAERRWIGGGSLSKTWTGAGAWSYAAGAETRYDHLDPIGLYRTQARVRLSTDREDRVDQYSAAGWGEASWRAGPLRATLGLRLDGMGVDVDSNRPINSGRKSAALVSPKLDLAWRVSDAVELYADAGRGFHSNDARGALAHVTPDGSTPIDPVNLLVAATGGEVGARWERKGFLATVTVWALKLDSELVYSGDAGDTESTAASHRLGAEFLVNWTPTRRLNFDASFAVTRARYVDAPGADRIPNALDYVATAGVTLKATDRTSGELTVRRLGPAALIEDNSARSKPATAANLLLRHRLDRVELFAEVLNVLDSHDNDITYFYTSRLKGEPAAGVADYHFHPMEPRTLRVGVKARF